MDEINIDHQAQKLRSPLKSSLPFADEQSSTYMNVRRTLWVYKYHLAVCFVLVYSTFYPSISLKRRRIEYIFAFSKFFQSIVHVCSGLQLQNMKRAPTMASLPQRTNVTAQKTLYIRPHGEA